MKIGEASQYLQQALQTVYDKSESSHIAHMVLEDCTGFARSRLWLQKEVELSPAQEKKLQHQLKRLLTHEPIHYILNKAWFYDMELYVDNSVLIPRPETEELVDWVVSDVKASGADVFNRGPVQADVTSQLKILDVGTGSGCIALALKKAMPKAEVWGCDVREEALNVARRNGSTLNIRVDFQGVNFLDEGQQTFLPTVDIIVSNPPYIPLRDQHTMQPNVLNFEPPSALFVPNEDALLFYKAIAGFARKRLYEKGAIYLEIHEASGADVVALFRNEGYQQIELKKDMQGKDRMVKVVRGA